MSSAPALHDVVAWALARIDADPAAIERARAALGGCVAELEASVWPEAVTLFSGLNASGCPVELAFGSRDRALRFTCEAAPPELPEHDRLARARGRLVELGAGELPDELASSLAARQIGAKLVWGAAVSGRHAREGDAFKIYVEPAPGPLTTAAPGLGVVLAGAALQRTPRLVMIGASPRGPIEHYVRSDGLAAGELARIVTRCGLADRLRELQHAISVAWQGTADRALEGVWGLSFAGPRDGEIVAVSVFKEVNRLLGADATARTRLLRLVRELDAGELEAYAKFSEPLAASTSTGAHGMLAITIASGRPLELRVGLDPLAVWRAR